MTPFFLEPYFSSFPGNRELKIALERGGGMKASDLFVKCLENEGVEYIFGLPGEENADVMMSLKRSSIKFVLCSHEQTVAFMADGNMDRTPLVVITGQADTKRMHKESHQAMNVVDMFKPLTKWARQIIHPDNISEVVRKAFKLAETEKPGACHIELPEDIAKQESNNQPVPFHKLRCPAPDEKIIDQAIALIEQAKRPVILAGNGAIRKRASQQLKQFVATDLPYYLVVIVVLLRHLPSQHQVHHRLHLQELMLD